MTNVADKADKVKFKGTVTLTITVQEEKTKMTLSNALDLFYFILPSGLH